MQATTISETTSAAATAATPHNRSGPFIAKPKVATQARAAVAARDKYHRAEHARPKPHLAQQGCHRACRTSRKGVPNSCSDDRQRVAGQYARHSAPPARAGMRGALAGAVQRQRPAKGRPLTGRLMTGRQVTGGRLTAAGRKWERRQRTPSRRDRAGRGGAWAPFRRALCSHGPKVLRCSVCHGPRNRGLLAPTPLVPYAGRERRRLLAHAHKLERSWRPEPQAHRCGRAKRWRLASRGSSPTEEAMSETSFSTPQSPSRKASRVPSPNGDESRTGGAEGAPPEGPAPPGSLTWRTRGRSAFEGLRRASTVRSGPFTVSWIPAVQANLPLSGSRSARGSATPWSATDYGDASGKQPGTLWRCLRAPTSFAQGRPPSPFPFRRSQRIWRGQRAPFPLQGGRRPHCQRHTSG